MPPPPPSQHPAALTPQFCTDTTALRDFLRLSRATVDDSISAHLNALLTPSRSNPSLSSPAPPPPRGSRRNIPDPTCAHFKRAVLFPSWDTRSQVLRYCARVADAAVAGEAPPAAPQDAAAPKSRNYWGREQVVDERLDPYSARDYSFTRTTRGEELRDVLRNEEGVERIVRTRTWSVLGERCLGGAAVAGDESWESEWRAWREERWRE